jgi:hypothetical protein
MANGPDITAQEFAFRAIRAAVPSAVPVETRPQTNGEIPYVFVGDSSVQWHPVGFEISLTVMCWSKKEGGVEVKQLQNAIRTALDWLMHVDAPASDASQPWRFTLITETSARASIDVSNSVWHGSQSFRILAETED